MPTKPKDEPAESKPVKAKVPSVRPTHAAQLCELCGTFPLDPEATHFACEHGTWDLSKIPEAKD